MLENFKKYRSTKKNLALTMTDNGFIVRYHWTDIVEVKNEYIILRSGGWETPSTKNHINAVIREFGLSISQVKWRWFLSGKNIGTVPFTNGMSVPTLEALL